jgi:DNA polymerase-3 subunit gamma/tau
MSSARAAINAALEAARSASRGSQPQAKRSTAQSNQAAALAPAEAQEVAKDAPPSARPAPQAPTPPSPSAGSAPPPWQTPAAPVATQATAAPAAAPAGPTAAYDDAGSEPPSWVTEFSDDTALAQDGAEVATMPVAAPVSMPAPARAPAAPKHAYVITPVEQLGWDGNWPALAADLPLRGVAQQLAFQTELIECVFQGNAATFRLRVPIDTLRASGNSEKLCAAVQERFPNIKVILETELGPVWYTASAEAQAWREACLRTAEQTVADDPFVQGMIRTFDAFVVPGSIKPAPAA